MMKSATAPRRIYVRNGITHVCFAGKTFAPPKGETTLDLEGTVTIEETEGNAKTKKAQVILTQKKKGKAALTETWQSVKVPRTARGEATGTEG
jgi:hypothetical protein